MLALSRQNLPPVRTEAADENLSRAAAPTGSRPPRRPRKVILSPPAPRSRSRSSVAEQLEEQGIGADVVSMPCTEAFDAQAAAYREDILPDVSNREILRVSIEAGTTFGWERYTGLHGLRIGIDRFGASAPATDLYEHFGLTAAQDHRAACSTICKVREIA